MDCWEYVVRGEHGVYIEILRHCENGGCFFYRRVVLAWWTATCGLGSGRECRVTVEVCLVSIIVRVDTLQATSLALTVIGCFAFGTDSESVSVAWGSLVSMDEDVKEQK